MKYPVLLLTFSFSLLAFHSNGQIINTIVGNGECMRNAYTGDTTLATSVDICIPGFITKDDTGNLYIADFGNNTICKLNNYGILLTIAGTGISGFSGDSGLAINAQISHPVGIAIDKKGNIYFSDELTARIRKIAPSGIISTIAGTGINGYNGDGRADTTKLNIPRGIAVDRNDSNLYIADYANNRIRKLNIISNIITTVAGNGIAGYVDSTSSIFAELHNPTDIAFDKLNNLYIADANNDRVRMVNNAGFISTVVGNGIRGYNGDSIAATAVELNFPFGISIDNSGNIYIADASNNRIRKVMPALGNMIITVAGTGIGGFSGDGGLANNAELNSAESVLIDSSENIYISDYNNYRIRWIKNTSAVASINNLSRNIKIYPNPANNHFFVFVTSTIPEDVRISITDVLGNNIANINATTNTPISATIDVPEGLYFISAFTNNNIYKDKIIIKY